MKFSLKTSLSIAFVSLTSMINPPQVMGTLFYAPDAQPSYYTKYSCTFHWFRTPDGRTIGLDLIRSDDTGQRGLRVFLIDQNGKIQSLVYEAPRERLEFVDNPDVAITHPFNFVGRGRNWIAGAVHASGQALHDVSFFLTLKPKSLPLTMGALGLAFVHLNAADFTEVHTSGRILINGQEYLIDSLGPAAIHFGDRLPAYAYIANVPERPDSLTSNAPQIIMASVRGDNLRVGSTLLGESAVTYSYGRNGVPLISVSAGPISSRRIRLSSTETLNLELIDFIDHQLLGMRTVTATAQATVELRSFLGKKVIDVGQVILDFRGDSYINPLFSERD